MKRLLFSLTALVLFLFSWIYFSSCNNCANLDCIFSDDNIFLRVQDKATGEDLMFGDSSIYEPDSIKVINFENGMNLTVKPSNRSDIGDYLKIDVPSPVRLAIIYNSSESDTIAVCGTERATKCCGDIILYENIGYKGQIIPLSYDVFIIPR